MLIDLISLYTGIIPDLSQIIESYILKLYIYHVSRDDWEYWHESCIGFVVVSKSIEPYLDLEMEFLDGRILKNNKEFNMNQIYFQWKNIKWDKFKFKIFNTITIRLIGEALDNYEDGQVICSSFHA